MSSSVGPIDPPRVQGFAVGTDPVEESPRPRCKPLYVSQAAVSHDLILGRYRPIRPLGSGGMGHVWLARDERTGLDVALKIVAREGKAGHRAEREARAAAALRHPRCQRIRSLARDPSHVYITYEYVPGRTLREAMRSGELDDRAMIEVAAQVCDALAHAHGRGIVHRDVKPSNVLLAETGEIDIRLLDFGLAQMAEFDTLTAFGDVPGTLAYISPERLGGAVATPAADVWAVGVLLWEGLAGRHPFWHGHGELNETTRRIEQGAPPLETLRPDLPAGIVQTVAGALVLNPERRPSAGRLAADLRSLPGRRRRTKGSRPASTPIDRRALLVERVLPATAAGVATGWATSALPFYPPGWSLGLGALAAAATMVGPRLGLDHGAGRTGLPAREHLDRTGVALRDPRHGLGRAHLARREGRPAARRRPTAGTDRGAGADPAGRPVRARRTAARAAGSRRRPARRAGRGPAPRDVFPSISRSRRSASASPARPTRPLSRTRCSGSSTPIRCCSPRR